ncbi:MAG: hypothetical protein WCP97_03070 [bacterium]
MNLNEKQLEFRGKQELFEVALQLKKEYSEVHVSEEYRKTLKTILLAKAQNSLPQNKKAVRNFIRKFYFSLVPVLALTVVVLLFITRNSILKQNFNEHGQIDIPTVPMQDFAASVDVQFSSEFSYPALLDKVPVYHISQQKVTFAFADNYAKLLRFTDKDYLPSASSSTVFYKWENSEHVLSFDRSSDHVALTYFTKEKNALVLLDQAGDFAKYEKLSHKTIFTAEEKSFKANYEQPVITVATKILKSLPQPNGVELYPVVVPGSQVAKVKQSLPPYFFVVYFHESMQSTPVYYLSEQHPDQSDIAFYIGLNGEFLGLVYNNPTVQADTQTSVSYQLKTPQQALTEIKEGKGKLVFLQFSDDENHYFYNPETNFQFSSIEISQIKLFYLKDVYKEQSLLLPVYVAEGTGEIAGSALVGKRARFEVILPNALEQQIRRGI